jgi:hypothetical protein
MLSGMGDGQAPREVLTESIAVAMTRRRLGHAALAERMQGLGYKWIRQTVGDVMSGRRSLRAEELYGLTLALETTVSELMTPHEDDAQIVFPSGTEVAGIRLLSNDQSLTWDEKNAPVVSPRAADNARLAAEGARELLERTIAKMLDEDDPRLAKLLETVLARHATEET